MKIQVGAGRSPLPGFVNIDPQDRPGCIKGHAHHIPVPDGSVSLLFANAVLEHLFLMQQRMAVHEWYRVTGSDGTVVVTGIPDFRAVATEYVNGAKGIMRATFDLLEVYRYTHGMPDFEATADEWREWSPSAQPNAAPTGWLPQLHKALFDVEMVNRLFMIGSRPFSVFRYAYKDEPVPVSLGVVSGPAGLDALDEMPDDLLRRDSLEVI